MVKVRVGERVGEQVSKTTEALGDYLKEQRLLARLSLRQLAELAGVSNPYLSQIERGLRRPSAEVLTQIAKAMRISAESLYVRAGIIDPHDGVGGSVELAVLGDTGLTERQKQSLLDVHASFLALNQAADRARDRARDQAPDPALDPALDPASGSDVTTTVVTDDDSPPADPPTRRHAGS